MKKKEITHSLIMSIFKSVLSTFIVVFTMVSVVPIVTEGSQKKKMSWSSEVETILEIHSDKFKVIYDYYTFRYRLSRTIMYLWFMLLGFFPTILILGTKIKFVEIFDFKENSRELSMINSMLRVISLICVSLAYFKVGMTKYNLYAKKGYIFLTDNGVLIIENGSDPKSSWLAYRDIKNIKIVSTLKMNKLNQDTSLHIIDKSFGVRVFYAHLFGSITYFQSLYLRLIKEHKNAIAKGKS